MTSKPKRGPSAEDQMRIQREAAERERARLEAEQAKAKEEADRKAVADLREQEAKRAAFAGKLQEGIGEDNQGRKKFLKGV